MQADISLTDCRAATAGVSGFGAPAAGTVAAGTSVSAPVTSQLPLGVPSTGATSAATRYAAVLPAGPPFSADDFDNPGVLNVAPTSVLGYHHGPIPNAFDKGVLYSPRLGHTRTCFIAVFILDHFSVGWQIFRVIYFLVPICSKEQQADTKNQLSTSSVSSRPRPRPRFSCGTESRPTQYEASTRHSRSLTFETPCPEYQQYGIYFSPS